LNLQAVRSGNPSDGQNRKEVIIEAGRACFAENGISKTSMENIAEAANVSRRTVYRYFDDKDHLILAILEREALSMIARILPRVSSAKNIGEFIVEGMLEAIREIPLNPFLSRMLEPDSMGISSRIVMMADRLIELTVAAVAPEVEKAQASGVLRKSLAPEMLIDWVIRNLFSLLTIPSSTVRTEDQKRALLRSMLLPAILAETDS